MPLFQKSTLPFSLFFLGGFVVDDDGAGYVDIGEEDDWSVAADGAEHGGKGKQQKKGKIFFSFFLSTSTLVSSPHFRTHSLSISSSPSITSSRCCRGPGRTRGQEAEEKGRGRLRSSPAPPGRAEAADRENVLRRCRREGRRLLFFFCRWSCRWSWSFPRQAG